MDLTQTLTKLLDQLYLLPEERRGLVVDAWPNMTDDEQEQMLDVLEELFEKQNVLMMTIVKNDPEFPAKLQTFMDKQIAEMRSHAVTDDASALASIEQKLS